MHTEIHTSSYTARRRTGAKPVSPQVAIQMIFDRCDGDRTEAAEAVAEPHLTGNVLHDHLIRLGARTAVGNLICSDRAKIFTGNPDADVTKRFLQMPVANDPGAARRRAMGRAAMEIRLLLDAPLSTGKRMSAAMKADVLAEADVYAPQAEDMAAKVRYFRLVAARLPDGKTVGDTLSNEQLTALLAEARGAVKQNAA